MSRDFTSQQTQRGDGWPVPPRRVCRYKCPMVQSTSRKRCECQLYELLTSKDTLRNAFNECKKGGSGPGLDGLTFDRVTDRHGGVHAYINGLHTTLVSGKYRPGPLKERTVGKPLGGNRTLCIPTITDRVVQKATLNLIQPYIDPLFSEWSYGFRPFRSQHLAIRRVHEAIGKGWTQVVDADIRKFFDEIPHRVIKRRLKETIPCRQVTDLIMGWMKAPKANQLNGPTSRQYRRTRDKGIPQGSPISPLVANLCLDPVDRYIDSLYGSTQAIMVRYADDIVILTRPELGTPTWILEQLGNRLRKVGLHLNLDKTNVIDTKHDHLEFLGYSFIAAENGRVTTGPSERSIAKFRQKMEARIAEKEAANLLGDEQVREELIQSAKGWVNYFSLYEGKTTAVNQLNWLLDRLNPTTTQEQKGKTKRSTTVSGMSPVTPRPNDTTSPGRPL